MQSEQSDDKDIQISSQFLNVFGFIDYKHDGQFPWITQNFSLSKEYVSITDLLGIDCEMVGVGNFEIRALGRVSIVNEYGYCVYDTFVNPSEAITDYSTLYSGIRPENLIGAPPVDSVVKKVASIVKGRILVGHSIHNDLEVLKLDHPTASIRDTANFFQHHNGSKRTPSLKNLINDYFNTTIQEGEHNSIQDAQAALRLYLLFREEWEMDALERRRKANLADTVSDITCMHVQPRPSDLFTESESVFIRPNKLVGAYFSSEEYKDIQFRLLLEDVLRPLRQDVRILQQRRLLHKHFRNIRIASGNSLENTNFEVKSFKTLLVPIQGNGLEEIDWDNRNIFLTGSLLILSPDNFRSVKFAKVVNIGANQRVDSVILHLKVHFLLDGPSWKITNNDRFQMIESKAFFLPYEYTLNFLLDVDLDTFPMKKYIVDAVTEPANLLEDSTKQIDFSILMNNPSSHTTAPPLDYQSWPSASQLNLDQSQYEGLQKAITKELTIIQGPPGTGKTHVSLQIVKLLLTNKWLSPTPILIVSYTNHALDELLEPILKFLTDKMHGGNLKKAEQSLLRIGGGCESETILPCTMTFKRGKLREKSTNKKLVKSLEKALLKVKGIDLTSKPVQRGILNFKLLPQLMLAKLEANAKCKKILTVWFKSQKDIERNVFSWFGLDKQSIEVRPRSLTSVSDGLFVLLCGNLESILSEKFSKIPITFDELNGKSLHNEDQDQQCLIRWGYYLFLVGQLASIIQTTERELIVANNAGKELEQYVKENPTLQQAKVVAMTTTGAVKYKKMIETKLKSKIMLVEEAAHVLEAYVVASLTRHCTQLILIGDHKQLRPMISDHDLCKDFLDVSLMERLVKNGIAQNNQNWIQLKVQHRMRADIAKLICPVIYDELENHSDVEAYPNVLGCAKNLFFVQHENRESSEHRTKSHYNDYEATYIVGLLNYFTECGYLPTQITVICTYLAQKTLIENTIKNDPKINRIQISTVDGYQGKQNDVIILSLVRNNKNNNVGFLKTDNRVCVALSRARHGLIMIGNMNMLASASDTWTKINRILVESDSIGPVLPLHHPQLFNPPNTLLHSTLRASTSIGSGRSHGRRRSKPKTATQSNRIATAPSGPPNSVGRQGTSTTGKIVCAHNASSKVKCGSKIVETLPCGHAHHVLCSQKGKKNVKCGSVVQKKMECGHTMSVACHKLRTATFSSGHQNTVSCQPQICMKKIEKQLSCGHGVQVVCAQKNAKVKCNSNVTEKMPCGHERHVLCKDKKRKTKCDVVVQKKMECGHTMPVACHERLTATCVAKIKKTFSCGHVEQVLCREQHSNVKCPAIVKHKYPCGHEHRFSCSAAATKAKKCNSNIKRKLLCGHTQETACHQNPLLIKCRQTMRVGNVKFECSELVKLTNRIDGVAKRLAEIKIFK